MGFLLYILSRVIGFLFIPLGILYSIFKSIYKNKLFSEGFPEINKKFTAMAIAFDIYGNQVGKEILTDFLLKDKTIHPFGKKNETISQALGWNKYYFNLTKPGKCLDKVLDFFDKNHSLKSINK